MADDYVKPRLARARASLPEGYVYEPPTLDAEDYRSPIRDTGYWLGREGRCSFRVGDEQCALEADHAGLLKAHVLYAKQAVDPVSGISIRFVQQFDAEQFERDALVRDAASIRLWHELYEHGDKQGQ